MSGCATSQLQLRASSEQLAAGGAGAAVGGCHDILETEGGACLQAITWAKTEGFGAHPDWYPGLDPETSPLTAWQFFAWNNSHPTCPRPCGVKLDTTWCRASQPPELWTAAPPVQPMRLKILSYNLYWWNLFTIRGGRSAGELIKHAGEPEPFDLIGLQECEDVQRVFGPPGLMGTYTAFIDEHSICMAYRTAAWTLLARGQTDVADDMHTEHYGRRSAQWMRLQHRKTGTIVFFMNHHGPLSVNSGGACGGAATANNLLKTMAANGRKGDTLVLVGDFNANAASRTIQSLWTRLLHVHAGVSFGGVDNIFSNVGRPNVESTVDLGSAGSDHRAISAVLSLGGSAAPMSTVANMVGVGGPALAVRNLERSRGSEGCLIEPGVALVGVSGWSRSFKNIMDARMCCNYCAGDQRCKAWTWAEWSSASKSALCTFFGETHTPRQYAEGVASGLPPRMAIAEAKAQAHSAL